jgi:hypothetical protein
VSLAVKKLGGDSSKVWKRNIALLEYMEKSLGRGDTETIMKGDTQHDMQKILSKFRFDE